MPRHARRDGRFLLILVGALVTIGVVNSFTQNDEWRRHGDRLKFIEPVIWETSSILVILAMTPLVMTLIRRAWPLSRPWWRSAALYAAAALAWSFVHVTGMGVLRWATYAAAGGHYNAFGPLRDFLYEFRKDLLAFAGLIVSYATWVYWRLPAAQPAEPGEIEVRDGARRHFVRLTDVAFIEAAGNYVELHRGPNPILHRAPLAEMERQLRDHGFVRIHRSRLVQRSQIAQVESKPSGDYVVRLLDGRELAGSRRYRRPLLEP